MTLFEYLHSDESPTPVQFAAGLAMETDAAVRQWKANPARKPAPEYAPAVEAATGWKVRRWDMYPTLWWRIWPELVDLPDAPALPPGARRVPSPPNLAVQA